MLILYKTAVAPTTTSMLKILLPIMLLTAMALLPVRAEAMLTAASGALVPNATIVSPIIIDGIFNLLARSLDPSTKKSAPLIRRTKPTTNNIMLSMFILHSSYLSLIIKLRLYVSSFLKLMQFLI